MASMGLVYLIDMKTWSFWEVMLTWAMNEDVLSLKPNMFASEKMLVGRLVSFWECLFSGGYVSLQECIFY